MHFRREADSGSWDPLACLGLHVRMCLCLQLSRVDHKKLLAGQSVLLDLVWDMPTQVIWIHRRFICVVTGCHFWHDHRTDDREAQKCMRSVTDRSKDPSFDALVQRELWRYTSAKNMTPASIWLSLMLCDMLAGKLGACVMWLWSMAYLA